MGGDPSDVVVAGIAYDGSAVYRKGAALAPQRIRQLSAVMPPVTEEGHLLTGMRVRDIGRFRGQSSYFTWLYRIAVNEANRALEKRARRPPSVPIGPDELRLPGPATDDPSRQAEFNELRRALAQALAELPPPLRTAIVLRDVEGLSTQEAAEIAGVGQAAFKSRLHQARLRVRAADGGQALVTAGG